MSKQADVKEPSGVLIINKHAGATSHDIVNRIRRLYGTRRVGHTGTLDPMATGVLVVLIGRAAKADEYLTAASKRYRATLRLGITTDTEDITGTTLTTSERIPSFEEIKAVLPKFRGKIQQIPPMYSALKVNGQKLVDLARQGVTVERKPREIEIFDLTAAPTERDTEYILDVCCSGGTYIRTLCADIGSLLGCGGAMATLERTEAGGFSLQTAHTVEKLETMEPEERLSLLIPTESLFADCPQVNLPAFYERLCRSGCEIYQKKISVQYAVGERVRLCDQNGAFFALGEVREYENGTAIKAIKTFSLND
ncbi:MAG: tRNA pseudouridine(55) synthase TruB [Ruminococcaceae bacterium]|nr:tRNA pseudouridine(55) synthase TruB [Oscillospiraceae bacterium]